MNLLEKKKVVFSSGADMLLFLRHSDVYSLEKEKYVFLYSESGAVAAYSIPFKEARRLCVEADESGEYWGAFLGPGGLIYDAEADGGHSALDFCNANYKGIWYIV